MFLDLWGVAYEVYRIAESLLGMQENCLAVQWPSIPERPIVGSSRVDLQACKLEYSIVSPK